MFDTVLMILTFNIFPVIQSLDEFNRQLDQGDPEAVFMAMKEVVKLVDTSNVFLFHSYSERYLEALRLEQKEGIPGSVLVRIITFIIFSRLVVFELGTGSLCSYTHLSGATVIIVLNLWREMRGFV